MRTVQAARQPNLAVDTSSPCGTSLPVFSSTPSPLRAGGWPAGVQGSGGERAMGGDGAAGGGERWQRRWRQLAGGPTHRLLGGRLHTSRGAGQAAIGTGSCCWAGEPAPPGVPRAPQPLRCWLQKPWPISAPIEESAAQATCACKLRPATKRGTAGRRRLACGLRSRACTPLEPCLAQSEVYSPGRVHRVHAVRIQDVRAVRHARRRR